MKRASRIVLRREPGSSRRAGIILLAPALIMYVAFVVWPLATTIGFSFFDWDGFSKPTFVGLQNYIELATDDDIFAGALRHNFILIGFFSLLPIVLGLFLTSIVTRRRVRGLSLFRAGIFLPYVVSTVAIGVVWRWIYSPVKGPLNELMGIAGLESLTRPWLGDFTAALPAVGVIGAWLLTGLCLTLFVAGTQRLDESVFDAAKVDGAGEFRQFWHVTLPGIRAEVIVAALITVIAAMRTFGIIFVTTNGGPGNQTMVTSLWIFRNAFRLNRTGYAAAMAVVQTTIVLGAAGVLYTMRRRVAADG